jgi:simple sugar transport system permease protein
MAENGKKRRQREPLTDTQMLMFISIGIFAAMYLAAMLTLKGGFLKPQQIFDLLNDNAALIIISCALTVVMIGGGINISVGGVIGLTVMACALFLNNNGVENSFLSILLTLLLALGIGLGFGLLQGFLVAHLEIQPFIVTLAGMFLARGLTTILSVNPVKVAHEGFQALVKTKLRISWLGYTAQNGNLIPAKIEIGAVVAVAVVILMFLLLRYTKLGRGIYAVGGNRQSALMLGINVRSTVFWSYVISGLLSGLAGFVFLMHKPAGNASVAMRSEMDAIAASIIGGTLLTGGVGNVIGTFFGAMILATIQKIIALSPLNASWWQDMANGAMLCFFILLQSLILMRRNNSKTGGKLLKNLKIHKADKTPEGKEEKHET